MQNQTRFKRFVISFLAILLVTGPILGHADERTGEASHAVRIWDLTAAYHAVKREFLFTQVELKITPEELNKKTLQALEFIETLNAYLASADENQTDLEKAPVRHMAEEIDKLLTETMINVLARQNNLQDGLASARVKAYFAAFETKIAERAARFSTEIEFQRLRLDQKFPSPGTLTNVARRDPVLLVYLTFLYEAFDYWRFSFKELRKSQSNGLMMQMISVSTFTGSFFSALNGHALESLLLLGVGSSLWRGFADKEWRQFSKLMNTFRGESRKYYLPLDFTRGTRKTFGSFKSCYEILSELDNIAQRD